MTIETPIWLQNGVYSARLDRAFIDRVLGGQDRVFDGLTVTQDGAGNFNVVVALGAAAVVGDDISEQGMYFVNVIASETIAVPATPGSGARTDTVILQVNDTQAGGGAGDNAVLSVIEGTTVPNTAVALAEIARIDTEPSILDAAITDVRPLGPYPYGVGTAPPPANGVAGDIYIRVAP